MKLSLIISTYNSPEALRATLASVLRQAIYPREIIIADDGSDESTATVIKDFSSQASLMAVVHKRHVKVFSQKKFQTCVEWKNYDKMHYLPEVES